MRKAEIQYKFNEGKLIENLREYINMTYSEHYSKNKFQSTEFIIDCGHGEGFALGNVLKYVQRYGKKSGRNRADLLKVLHYAIIALHVHDAEIDDKVSKEDKKLYDSIAIDCNDNGWSNELNPIKYGWPDDSK